MLALLLLFVVSAHATWTQTHSLPLLPLPKALALPSGTILVASSNSTPTTAVITSSSTTNFPPLIYVKRGGAMTLLASGRVLYCGGVNAACEIGDPVSTTWTLAASMTSTRESHTLTQLANGKVLVCGGIISINSNPLMSCELYDPVINSFSPTAGLLSPRYDHAAIRLPSGDVLIAAGRVNSSGPLPIETYLYKPATAQMTLAGNLNGQGRVGMTATEIPISTSYPAGGALLAGGIRDTFVLSTLEFYNANGTRWIVLNPMNSARCYHVSAWLSSTQLAFIGGYNSSGLTPLDTIDIYDLDANNSTFGSPLNIARAHAATATLQGKVVVIGGKGISGDLKSVETYTNPTNAPTSSPSSATPTSSPTSVSPTSAPSGSPCPRPQIQATATACTVDDFSAMSHCTPSCFASTQPLVATFTAQNATVDTIVVCLETFGGTNSETKTLAAIKVRVIARLPWCNVTEFVSGAPQFVGVFVSVFSLALFLVL